MVAFNRLSTAAALAAALAMGAAPASAAEMPRVAHPAAVDVWDGDASSVEGWGYRGYRGYHSRNHVRTGDVVAGVVVLGTIAAIASAANNRDRYRDRAGDYRYPSGDYRGRDYRYDERGDYRRDMRADAGARGMERAVDMCVGQVERGDTRVETIDNARRDRDGWAVSGQLRGGGGFDCRIDNDGRVRNVDIGGSTYSDAGYRDEDDDGRAYAGARYDGQGEGQLDDAAYSRARASQADSRGYEYRDAPQAEGPQPEYPGGPIPGEDTGSDWQDDGRYDTASAPDFNQPS